MDIEVLNQLRTWGANASASEVMAFYQARLTGQDRDNVRVINDAQYGPHPRHRMDIYVEDTGGSPSRPVLVFFHGGGFVRGDKSDRSNLGWWGAKQGFLTVVVNYRLAPEAQWPAGGEDVALAWKWLRKNAIHTGGNPHAMVLAGESAGAAHVATAALIREMQPEDWAIAGAFLLSGPYDARMERMARGALGIPTPDPRNDAYFGAERTEWLDASILERVDARPFPVWVGMAEKDLPHMQVQAGALFHRLVTRHGYVPQWWVLSEHNHFSPFPSLGTEDETLARPLAAFVRGCTQRSQASA